MSFKYAVIGLSAALCLSACATYQENPNYQYSSKYDGQDAPTQLATNTSQPQPQTVTYSAPIAAPRQTIIASTPVAASPYPDEVTIINPAAIAPSPTDSAYAGQTVIGTPGYGLYAPETVEAPNALEIAPSAAQAIEYDYSENVVVAGADVPLQQFETRGLSGMSSDASPTITVPGANYTVQQGDTVYSMARRLCVGINEISGPNNLGADFNINIGQAIKLPASRC